MSYIDELKKAMQQEYEALEQARKQQESALDQQKDPIRQDAAKLRGDTYQNARVSAIGSNEVLAQKGLAGGVYQDPRSGYSETSRVRQDTALRNALSAADLNEQKQLTGIDEKIKQLGYDAGKQQASIQAKWNEKIAQAVREDELRRIQQEREEQLRRLQQEREDQLRREQWAREDAQRREDHERQLALVREQTAAAARAYSSAPSGYGSAGYSESYAPSSEDYASAYRQRVIDIANASGIQQARTMSDISNIQNRAYAQALRELRGQLGSGSDYRTVASLIGAPEFLW